MGVNAHMEETEAIRPEMDGLLTGGWYVRSEKIVKTSWHAAGHDHAVSEPFCPPYLMVFDYKLEGHTAGDNILNGPGYTGSTTLFISLRCTCLPCLIQRIQCSSSPPISSGMVLTHTQAMQQNFHTDLRFYPGLWS